MIKKKLTEILQHEKNEIEILQTENSYEFELLGNNYLIVVDQINISESLNDAIDDNNKVFYNLEFSDNFFKISLHLSTWLTNSSISFFKLLSLFNCCNKSWDIILIVDSGVPNECAAAAACEPKETNSCSFEINS